MPYRNYPLAEGEIYHVFNRSVAKEPIFSGSRESQRFLNLIDFYRFQKPGIRYSHYNNLSLSEKVNFLDSLHKTGKKLVEIYAFAIMPNHFHFLLRQKETKGISIFLRNLQNSYARYINTKFKRTGSLFQAMFKAIRIESDEQLIHLARYIHLNPLTSFVIQKIEDMDFYELNSYMDYLGKRNLPFLDKSCLASYFKSVEALVKFTTDQIEYQRTLERIKHLLLDQPDV